MEIALLNDNLHILTSAISKQIVVQKYKFTVESSWSYVKIAVYIVHGL